VIGDLFASPEAKIVVGLLYTVLAFVSPRAALFVILPTTAIAGELRAGSVLFRPDDVMMAILAISWVMRRLMSPPRPATPLDKPLLAYAAIGLVATLWGTAIGTADLTGLNKVTASGLHLLKRFEFVIYFFILTDVLRSVADVRRMLYVFMGSLVALSIFSFGRFQATGTIALGPEGTPIHEPGLASMLNIGLALGLIVTSRSVRTNILAGALLLASLWVLPFSLGRNYLSATALMIVIVLFSRKRAMAFMLPLFVVLFYAAMLALPSTGLFPTNVGQRFSTLGSVFTSHASASGVSLVDRLGPAVAHSWEVITSSPLVGWGLGSIALGSMDSEYATQMVYTGILGFAIFIWLVVRIARMVGTAYDVAQAQDSPARPWIAGLQHCLLGYALYSTFSPSISAARAGAFFFTVLGLAAVLYHQVVERPATEAAAEPAEELPSDQALDAAPQWTV
jgi:hypothetical protein